MNEAMKSSVIAKIGQKSNPAWPYSRLTSTDIESDGVAGIGCTVGLGDGFPDKAQNLLKAFYVAVGANNERTKIGALRRRAACGVATSRTGF